MSRFIDLDSQVYSPGGTSRLEYWIPHSFIIEAAFSRDPRSLDEDSDKRCGQLNLPEHFA